LEQCFVGVEVTLSGFLVLSLDVDFVEGNFRLQYSDELDLGVGVLGMFVEHRCLKHADPIVGLGPVVNR
jgi:hypothetical protein